jgi:hypothetical protein
MKKRLNAMRGVALHITTTALILIAPNPGTNAPMTSNPSESAGQATSAAISVTAPHEGAIVRQGDTIEISWQSSNAPARSAVALFAEKIATGKIFDPIAIALPLTGNYRWRVPVYVPQPVSCAPDVTGACIGDMNPGTIYKIVARLYSPADAEFSEFGPTKRYPTFHAWSESGAFTMLAKR